MNTPHSTAIVQSIDTPDGPFMIVADEQDRVLASGWTSDVDALTARIHAHLRPTDWVWGKTSAAAAAKAFYAGDVDAIRGVTVAQQGTPMQLAGWVALRDITPGQPLTYAEFAAALGSASAVRAAASICARNAPALFVPCHRVLRTGGAMGGFAWGTDVKQSLLAREAASAQ